MYKQLPKLVYNFSRNIRKPTRAQSDVEGLGKSLTQKDIDDYNETFAPLVMDEPQVPPPSNKLVKEIQRQLLYSGEDKHPTKLVNRIQKGAVWGLGGQLIQFSRKLNRQGVDGTVQDIKQYLLNQQTKDIYVHDFGPVKPHIRQWAIIASAYSNRHCYKVGIDLKNALSLNKKPKQYPAQMVGRKDDEWVLVEFADITIHIMTEEERKEADLEWKWNNPVSEEVIEKYNQMANHKSRGFFEPLND